MGRAAHKVGPAEGCHVRGDSRWKAARRAGRHRAAAAIPPKKDDRIRHLVQKGCIRRPSFPVMSLGGDRPRRAGRADAVTTIQDLSVRLQALEQENATLRQRLADRGDAVAVDPKRLREMLHDLRQPVQAARLFHGLLTRRLSVGEEADRLARLGQAIEAMEQGIMEIQKMARGQGD